MADLQMRFACWDYDRTRALMDGSVKPEGIALTYENLFPAVTFQRMVGTREFECSELGLTFYLATLHAPDPPFVAIPVYPVRLFPYQAVFVNANAGIREPKDLIGKKVGELFLYGHDAGTWSKGALADEYGVKPELCEWFIGGVDRPMQEWKFVLQPPANVKVTHIGGERTLDAMLETGEIAALHSAIVPPSYMRGSKTVRRLFDDNEAAERAYYKKTGIFPIMHVVAIRKDVYQANKWVAKSLYDAMKAAKQKTMELYRMQDANMQRMFMNPFTTELRERTRAMMGEDHWPYGLKANYKSLDTFLRYHHEHGLSKRRFKPEELFVPECLDD
jgi:4,5-dihydroxyphthalate decarboxylase